MWPIAYPSPSMMPSLMGWIVCVSASE